MFTWKRLQISNPFGVHGNVQFRTSNFSNQAEQQGNIGRQRLHTLAQMSGYFHGARDVSSPSEACNETNFIRRSLRFVSGHRLE